MLYRYKTYQDVRLVFAPEEQAATFGGDYDNFTYPRYALDFALLRVYEDGQPLRPEHFLRLSDKAANAQEMVIAVGHPASTQRGLTVAQRQYHRDTQNPLQMGILQKRIAALTTYMAQGSEQARRGNALLRNLENTQKRLAGQQEGLRDVVQMQRLQKEEEALRAEVRKRPELLQKFGDAWFKVQAVYGKLAPLGKRSTYVSVAPSKLLTMALQLLRLPEELKKPSGERMEEFRDSRLPALRRELLSAAPIYADLEEAVLTDWLSQVQAALGNGDPFVQALLGGQTPQAVAHKLATEGRLTELEERRALLDGGTFLTITTLRNRSEGNGNTQTDSGATIDSIRDGRQRQVDPPRNHT